LVDGGITRVVDVRLTQISRKPGFSKNRLSQRLEGVGISYEHRPELGNPKSNRGGFAGSAEQLVAARDVFTALLAGPTATAALRHIVDVAADERVALMCFEADQGRCHRDLLLAEVARQANASSDS
jgi:uncharacterized protein (DUF488 family)